MENSSLYGGGSYFSFLSWRDWFYRSLPKSYEIGESGLFDKEDGGDFPQEIVELR